MRRSEGFPYSREVVIAIIWMFILLIAFMTWGMKSVGGL